MGHGEKWFLYTAQIKIRADGTFEAGGIKDRAEITLGDLKKTVEAAGGSMDDVTQMIIYITNPEIFPIVNDVIFVISNNLILAERRLWRLVW